MSAPVLERDIAHDVVLRRDLRVEGVVAAASLVLSLSQFLTGRLPSAFDSGVYFAASSEFVSGHLPYRDFAFVQPPGGLLLLSPWALIGRWTSLPFAFTLARGCSAVVVAAVAVLVSRLTLSYGHRASLVAGVTTALAPTAVYEMTSVKHEVRSPPRTQLCTRYSTKTSGRGTRPAGRSGPWRPWPGRVRVVRVRRP